jgi:hypothetical protein
LFKTKFERRSDLWFTIEVETTRLGTPLFAPVRARDLPKAVAGTKYRRERE